MIIDPQYYCLIEQSLHAEAGFHPERNFLGGEVGVAVSRTMTPPPIKN